MKLLVLSPRLPHARALSGYGIVYRRIRQLAERGHAVALAAFRDEDDEPQPGNLEPGLLDLRLVPHRRLPDSLQPGPGALWSHPPFPFNRYASARMLREVGELMERHRFDIVLAEFSVMGQFLIENPWLSAVRKVISVHHCHSVVRENEIRLHRYGAGALLLRMTAQRLRRYEFGMYRRVDRVLTLTPEERMAMHRHGRDVRVDVVPSGVDTRLFAPAGPSPERPTLIFTGHLADEANRDAATWFLREVWPLLAGDHAGLNLMVVGPGVSDGLRSAARRDARVAFTGEVPDVRPYLAQASVFVCPVRLGSGMRNKILEAMACGVPVVTTSLGAEGIALRNGETGFIGDTPELMARWIRLLLDDPQRAQTISRAARAQVEERYDWAIVGRLLEERLLDTLARP